MGQGVTQPPAELPVRYSPDSGILDPLALNITSPKNLIKFLLPGIEAPSLLQAITLTAEYDEIDPVEALRMVIRRNADLFDPNNPGKTSLIPTGTHLTLQIFTGTYGERVMKVRFAAPLEDTIVTKYLTNRGNGWTYNPNVASDSRLTMNEEYRLQGVSPDESIPYLIDREIRYASNMLNSTEPLHEMGEESGKLSYAELLQGIARLRPFNITAIYDYLRKHQRFSAYNIPARLSPISLGSNGDTISHSGETVPIRWGDIRFLITKGKTTRRYNLVIATIMSDRETNMKYLSVYCGYAFGKEKPIEGAFVTKGIAFNIAENDRPGVFSSPSIFRISTFKAQNEELAVFVSNFLGLDSPASQQDIDRFLALVINPKDMSTQGHFG